MCSSCLVVAGRQCCEVGFFMMKLVYVVVVGESVKLLVAFAAT